MLRSRLLVALLLLTSSALAAPAGGPRHAAPRALEVTEGVADVRLCSERYRATYEAGRLRFQGGAAPAPGETEAHPGLELALQSVRRGPGTLFERAALVSSPPPRGTADGFVVDWPGFREVYEARAHGLEQSFVFEFPLPGRGELAVRLELATELDLAHASPQTIAFAEGRCGVVSIQGVVGIDAAGRRAPGELRYLGDAVDLVLPASFVDDAAYPLVLDPVIVPLFEIPSGDDDSPPDVAYGAIDLACITWLGGELDHPTLYVCYLVDGTVISIQPVFDSEVHAFDSSQPVVAYVHGRNAFVIALGRQTGEGADTVLVTVTPSTIGAVDTMLLSTKHITQPDIGGDPVKESDLACLTWTREASAGGAALAQLVRVDASLALTPASDALLVDDGTAGTSRKVRISQSNGYPGTWLLVWERWLMGAPWPHFATVDVTAAVGGHGRTTEPGSWPTCDGDGEHFLVAYLYDDGEQDRILGDLVDVAGDEPMMLETVELDSSEDLLGPPEVAVLLNPDTWFNAYAVVWQNTPFTYLCTYVTEPSLDPISSPWGAYGSQSYGTRIASRFAATHDPELGADTFALAARLGVFGSTGLYALVATL